MLTESPIALRRLKGTWPDGSMHDVVVEIGKPYPTGSSFRCAIRVSGLYPEYSPPDMAGFDEIQALTQSLKMVRFLFEQHLELGGHLFYPDDDTPYTPDDLPETRDDEPA